MSRRNSRPWPRTDALRAGPRVDGDRLGCRGRDSLAQFARGEHLRLRAVGEQSTEGVFLPLELRDHRRPLAVLDDAGRAEVADLPSGDAQGDLDSRSAPLERFGAARPRGGEVEALRARARFGALPRGDDPRYAVYALLSPATGEQIPDTGFEDEPEGVEAPRDDGRALPVADLEPSAAPQRPRDHRQVRNAVLLAEPAARVDVEQPRGPPGPLLKVGGQGRDQLQPGCGQLATESEFGRRPDEERLRFRGIEPGQPGSIPTLEPVAARGAADGDDRDSGFRESLGVALHRPLRDPEQLGEVDRVQLPTGLQHEQERDETAC